MVNYEFTRSIKVISGQKNAGKMSRKKANEDKMEFYFLEKHLVVRAGIVKNPIYKFQSSRYKLLTYTMPY